MADLDKILGEAEKFMRIAKRVGQEAEEGHRIVGGPEYGNEEVAKYTVGIYYGIKALYEQNKAIIELLKTCRKNLKRY